MSREMTFSIYCLENYKRYHRLTGKQAHDLFSRYGVFDYLKESYDVLHSTGYQYMNRDIDVFLRSRNAILPNDVTVE